MHPLRLTLTLLLLLLVASIMAGCGDDAGSNASSADTDNGAEPAPEPGTQESNEGRTASSATFALTPELAACMGRAGFTQDAPPTGGLAAWRHASGARVVVAASSDVTLGIASEIGTAKLPANVEGTFVVAAPEAQSEAAQVCLEP